MNKYEQMSNLLQEKETALYLHGMLDREYTDICITVPPRFNQTRLRSKGVIVHQEKPAIYQLGIVEVETNYRNMVRTYNKDAKESCRKISSGIVLAGNIC